jgi:hypothetical protein
MQLIDALAINIEPDYGRARARKSDGNWQPDIAQADNGDFALTIQV